MHGSFSQPLDSSHMLREFNTLAPGEQIYSPHTCTCEDVRIQSHALIQTSTPQLPTHCFWPLLEH